MGAVLARSRLATPLLGKHLDVDLDLAVAVDVLLDGVLNLDPTADTLTTKVATTFRSPSNQIKVDVQVNDNHNVNAQSGRRWGRAPPPKGNALSWIGALCFVLLVGIAALVL